MLETPPWIHQSVVDFVVDTQARVATRVPRRPRAVDIPTVRPYAMPWRMRGTDPCIIFVSGALVVAAVPCGMIYPSRVWYE